VPADEDADQRRRAAIGQGRQEGGDLCQPGLELLDIFKLWRDGLIGIVLPAMHVDQHDRRRDELRVVDPALRVDELDGFVGLLRVVRVAVVFELDEGDFVSLIGVIFYGRQPAGDVDVAVLLLADTCRQAAGHSQ
jgi:hypothetical protein